MLHFGRAEFEHSFERTFKCSLNNSHFAINSLQKCALTSKVASRNCCSASDTSEFVSVIGKIIEDSEKSNIQIM